MLFIVMIMLIPVIILTCIIMAIIAKVKNKKKLLIASLIAIPLLFIAEIISLYILLLTPFGKDSFDSFKEFIRDVIFRGAQAKAYNNTI